MKKRFALISLHYVFCSKKNKFVLYILKSPGIFTPVVLVIVPRFIVAFKGKKIRRHGLTKIQIKVADHIKTFDTSIFFQ